MAVTHRHTTSCLSAWSGCPGLEYHEWVALAARRLDQGHAWREHERWARINEREKRDLAPYYELGGEA